MKCNSRPRNGVCSIYVCWLHSPLTINIANGERARRKLGREVRIELNALPCAFSHSTSINIGSGLGMLYSIRCCLHNAQCVCECCSGWWCDAVRVYTINQITINVILLRARCYITCKLAPICCGNEWTFFYCCYVFFNESYMCSRDEEKKKFLGWAKKWDNYSDILYLIHFTAQL